MGHFDRAAGCYAVEISYWGLDRGALHENLEWVCRKAPDAMRGEPTRAEAGDGSDSGVYIYRRQMLAERYGTIAQLGLYVVFGSRPTEEAVRHSLTNADGHVFVASRDSSKRDRVAESFEDLRRLVDPESDSLPDLPLVIRLGPGRLDDAFGAEELRALLTLPDDFPIFDVPELPYGLGASARSSTSSCVPPEACRMGLVEPAAGRHRSSRARSPVFTQWFVDAARAYLRAARFFFTRRACSPSGARSRYFL